MGERGNADCYYNLWHLVYAQVSVLLKFNHYLFNKSHLICFGCRPVLFYQMAFIIFSFSFGSSREKLRNMDGILIVLYLHFLVPVRSQ